VTPRTISIVLGQRAIKSTVAIDGVDITSSVTGFEVSAHVHDLTRVTLFLSAAVEITGEAGELLKSIPSQANEESTQK
jgi:hypothetical protein